MRLWTGIFVFHLGIFRRSKVKVMPMLTVNLAGKPKRAGRKAWDINRRATLVCSSMMQCVMFNQLPRRFESRSFKKMSSIANITNVTRKMSISRISPYDSVYAEFCCRHKTMAVSQRFQNNLKIIICLHFRSVGLSFYKSPLYFDSFYEQINEGDSGTFSPLRQTKNKIRRRTCH